MWTIKDGFLSDDEFPFFNLVTTKQLGDMKDETNRTRLCSLTGTDPKRLVGAKQVHGGRAEPVSASDGGKFIEDTDALAASEKGMSLAIFTADCVPVLLGAEGKACAAAHAGWRGLMRGIIPAAVKLLAEKFGVDPRGIYAAIGPHICSGCYEIGGEIRQAFGLAEHERTFSLEREAVRQLNNAGVRKISSSGRCTFHEAELFFSHRKDKTTARIMSLARL